MDNSFVIMVVLYLVINLAAFLTMLLDKLQSRKSGAERISEGVLFFWAVAFGSLGVYAGMLIFQHKTRKWYFIFGIPLLIFQNAAFLYLAYLYLNGQI
jgi:uncharacterized membrane protein YsdA (DUF1294 family)